MRLSNLLTISKAELVETQIASASNPKLTIERQPNLDGKYITGIEFHGINDVTVSPNGRANCNDTVFKKTYLTLEINGQESIDKMPIVSMTPDFMAGLVKNFDFIKVNWEKSYFTFGTTSSLSASESLLYTVYYVDKP